MEATSLGSAEERAGFTGVNFGEKRWGRLEVNALTEEVGSCIGFPAFELLRSHVFKSPRKHPLFRDALCLCLY